MATTPTGNHKPPVLNIRVYLRSSADKCIGPYVSQNSENNHHAPENPHRRRRRHRLACHLHRHAACQLQRVALRHNGHHAGCRNQVNDFHKWEAWSPWAKLDPDCKNSFEGPTSGKGAKFAWDGNKDVGAGNMEIVESAPNDHIKIRLEFTRPFANVNDTLFTFKPIGDKTNVSWTMSGKNNFVGKAFSLIMDCDKMVGPQFEKGLASMETAAAAESK